MIVYVLYATDVKSDMRIRVQEKKVQNVPIVNNRIVVDVTRLTHFTTMACDHNKTTEVQRLNRTKSGRFCAMVVLQVVATKIDVSIRF